MMGSDMPLGVATFHAVLSKWNYDADPKTPLYYPKAFADLKEEINKDGQDFILLLITKRLLENNHKITVELFPSTTVAQNHVNVSKEGVFARWGVV
jgi:Zn-dependent M16 (insulinase) family peptidase